ncbi:MAG: alpha/beta hydrolase [Chloroflexi bacterium]|nr:alpha/beta hydrolase [Chloroflexota bacterium]
MIPFVDFGGAGPLLHFAHANGYPPQAYKQLIETLTPRYHICSMPFRPLWPDNTINGFRDWNTFVEDLIRFFDERGHKDLIGVGHSLGAVVTLTASLRRPDLFRALVLIDPVIFHRRFQYAWRISQKLGLARRAHPLIAPTLRRRRVFESAEIMYQRYRRAPIFSRVSDAGLRAYVDSIAKPRLDGHVELAYTPEWEVKIYETAHFDMWEEMKSLRAPLLVIRGADSDTFFPQALRRVMKHAPHTVAHEVQGAGHLVPLERPDEVGAVIKEFLSKVR